MIRVGIGTDVHALVEGVPLWCAGIHFPDEPRGLSGHSDGDVAAHAACDALFGACGLGDMGSNYGTSDPEWAGASGVAFLTETARRVRAAGFDIGNVAVQVIGNRPRLAARRADAEQVMSAAGVPGDALRDDHRWAGPHRTRRRRGGRRDGAGDGPRLRKLSAPGSQEPRSCCRPRPCFPRPRPRTRPASCRRDRGPR